MIKRQDLSCLALAALISICAWQVPNAPWLMAMIFFIPQLWLNTTQRWAAFGVYYLYLLIASFGLVEGIRVYFHSDYLHSLLIWLGAPILGAFPLLLVWSKSYYKRVLLIPVTLMLFALPPFSLAGWSHPFVASGWLLPNWGWFGLLIVLLAMLGISYLRNIKWTACAVVCVFLLAYLQQDTYPKPDSHFIGLDHFTSFPANREASESTRDYFKEAQQNFALQDKALAQPQPLILYPEAIAGQWNPALANSWRRALKHTEKTVLFGVIAKHPQQGFRNVIAMANAKQASIVYQQRYPIPLGMWRPFQPEQSTVAHWFFGQSTVQIKQKRMGILVCYESLLLFPVLQTLADSPDVLLLTSSLWWSPPSIQQAQSNTMKSWSRLFAIPLIEAYQR